MADGVGSWVERNVDPAIYSRLLMENSKKAAATVVASADSPRKVLEAAHRETNVQVLFGDSMSGKFIDLCFHISNKEEPQTEGKTCKSPCVTEVGTTCSGVCTVLVPASEKMVKTNFTHCTGIFSGTTSAPDGVSIN